MKKIIFTICSLFFIINNAYNQNFQIQKDYFIQPDDTIHTPCISLELYQKIENEIMTNRKKLGIKNIQTLQSSSIQLEWPLKPAPALNDCGYYSISAYVDQNKTTGQVKDWNCGTRTYDGHRGVDLVPWPFIWTKMDSNWVHVVAAAPGVILAKVDTNFDRVCNGVGGGGTSNNYIIIQHNDGSTALYVHLKSGSFTTKSIGDSVSTGEFLGIVGSAGQSTGVHLHFEIRSDGTFANYIDPFYGNCNAAVSSSWWRSQKPYDDPELLKLSLHYSWPYMGVCPVTKDTLNEQYNFISKTGQQATFYVCTRDVAPNAAWDLKIIDANNKVFDSWNFSNNATPRKTSTIGFNKTLPTTPGTYTFQVTFNGKTCSKNFYIENNAGISDLLQLNLAPYPNPTSGLLYINTKDEPVFLYNSLGYRVHFTTFSNSQISFQEYPDGIYYLVSKSGIYKIVKLP